MQKLRVVTTVVVLLACSGAARASHFVITGGINEANAVLANLADCESGRELEFIWTALGAPALGREYAIEIRSTTQSGSGCTFESGTDNCTVREPSQTWDEVLPITRTYTVTSFFTEEGCVGSGARKAILFLRDTQPPFVGGTVEEAARGEVEFRYDFDPPPVPAAPTVTPGDGGLRVSWPAPSAEDDTKKFRVYWASDPTVLVGVPSCSGDYRTSCAAGSIVSSSSYRVSGLTNGERVYVALAALDEFDNESDVSGTVEGTPREENDYFEHYRNAGGQETGGFCFIATASYGSAWHPLVGSLRRFRDRVLLKTELGRDLVSFYYSWSPAMAEVIDDTPFLKGVFQILLAPIAAIAWFVVDAPWYLKILILLGLFLLWRLLGLWRHGRKAAVAALLLFCVAIGPASAEPSPRDFYLELKIGAIGPNLDSRDGLTGTPYADVFGSASRLVSGFELEWQILKKYGSFGVSWSMLFFQSVGTGRDLSGGTGTETTVLNVIPLQVNAVYRWDVAMRRWRVPLVPYAKFGFDYYIWWILNGAGDVSEIVDTNGDRRRALGGTFGLHFTLGLQFQLDVIDRRMQRSLDEDTGINHSYFFAEIVFSNVDDFTNSSLNFSSIYFLAGLALEF